MSNFELSNVECRLCSCKVIEFYKLWGIIRRFFDNFIYICIIEYPRLNTSIQYPKGNN